MASGSKRWLHDQVRRLKGQRTRSDSSPEPLAIHDNSPPTEKISAPAAQVKTSPVTSARKTILGGLRGSLTKPPRSRGESSTRFQTNVPSSSQDDLTERGMDVIIKHLSPVHDAYHNAALPTSVTKRVGCTPGTRIELLETAQDWAHGGNPAKIFWLNGMAGTGKTTIAYTPCEMLERDNLLGASFFCSRNSPDCQDVNRIVLTIAYQLAQYSNPYRQEVLKALKGYSDISKRDVGAQFRHLISEPFERVGRAKAISKDVIVVIDALDECANEAGTRIVLDMLIQHAVYLPIKFFVASRPESTISNSMETRGGALRSIFWLHDIEASLVQADIKLYLVEALASVNISPSEIDQLATRAGNLFIFAATTRSSESETTTAGGTGTTLEPEASRSVNSVAFSPDGNRIALGSSDSTIRPRDSHPGKSVTESFEFRGHTDSVRSITFSPNGARIVSGSYDKTARMWDANHGTMMWTYNHTKSVNCVAFSPNGTQVVSGSDDTTILVLDADNGAVLHGPFTGHTQSVCSVAFSPDGTRVVSGSEDRTVHVWDVESGAMVVGPLKGHAQAVRSVAFSPDGARTISGSDDGTIRFWDIAAATRPDIASFDGWSSNRDGWLTDSQSQLLFWVPSNLRHGFWFPTPSNPRASNVHTTTRLDQTTLLGERWHECNDASLESISS